jgi:hypothetical protein
VAASSASSPSAIVVKGGTGLSSYNYANVASFAQQVLQYLESLKNMEVDRVHPIIFWLIVFFITCVASTAKLEAAYQGAC